MWIQIDHRLPVVDKYYALRAVSFIYQQAFRTPSIGCLFTPVSKQITEKLLTQAKRTHRAGPVHYLACKPKLPNYSSFISHPSPAKQISETGQVWSKGTIGQNFNTYAYFGPRTDTVIMCTRYNAPTLPFSHCHCLHCKLTPRMTCGGSCILESSIQSNQVCYLFARNQNTISAFVWSPAQARSKFSFRCSESLDTAMAPAAQRVELVAIAIYIYAALEGGLTGTAVGTWYSWPRIRMSPFGGRGGLSGTGR